MKIKFWNYLAKNFDKLDNINLSTVECIKKYIFHSSTVLELGGGTGNMSIKLAPYCKKIECTDLSPEMIKRAQDKTNSENIHFSVQDAQRLDFSDKSFDLVIGLNLLHVMTNIDNVLQEISRVLKPGGIFICQTAVYQKENLKMKVLKFLMRMMGFRLREVEEYKSKFANVGLSIETLSEDEVRNYSVIMISQKR